MQQIKTIKIRAFVGALFLLFAFASCSPTKHLKESELLLRSNQITLVTDKTYAEKSLLRDELRSVIVQKNNTYLFGMIPYKVWLYNVRYKKYQSDPSNFQIKSQVVEAPVVFNPAQIAPSVSNMTNLLINQGYFDAEVTADYVVKKKKKVYVKFLVDTKKGYLIDSSKYNIDSSALATEMLPEWTNKTLLKQGKKYTNALLAAERSNMVNTAKNKGYYKFNTDNILFELDTSDHRTLKYQQTFFENTINIFAKKIDNIKPTVDVTTFVKEEEDYKAFQKFKFKNIFVYPHYNELEKTDSALYQYKIVNGVTFRYKKNRSYVNRNVLRSKIFLQPNGYYKQSDYDNTLLQLNDLGIFNFARIYILDDEKDSAGNYLNAFILLAPNKKYDFNTNFEVSGGDLYVAGTSMNASVTNKNFLRGANQLTASISYGLELNQDKNSDKPYFKRFYLLSQNIGANFKIIFPKFLLPFKFNFYNSATPKTVLGAGINVMDRTGYFRLRNINSSFGYLWKQNEYKSWQVNPVFVNSLKLSNVSDTFRRRMQEVQAIGNAYQETFIEGQNMEFIYNTEGLKPNNYTYLKLGVEEAGILMKGIERIVKSPKNGNGFNFNYATYFRFDFDIRQYLKRMASSINFRFYGGVGIPYGTARTLPYIKQFFVGGPYSIRGWGPRLLGPGSYYNEQAQNSEERLFVDQSGDIKLELNGEYRFNMLQLFSGAIGLNGAVFADAGNIWLTKKDPALPGAEFAFNKLAQDIAVSAGAGLRADIGGFLILRADWAVPLKKPYLINGNKGWVLNEIDFSSKDWRKKNINLNIGIGFPF